MKKIVIALFFMLFVFATIASAQITIAGQSVSVIVIIPLVLMVVFMLIFGIIIFFDRYREKKEMRALEAEKEETKLGIMEKIREKVQKREEKAQKKVEVTKPKKEEVTEEYRSLADYLDEISDLKKNFKKLSADSAFKKLGTLIKNFFSDYLGIDYEITFEELENELKAKSKEVIFFSKNLSEMRYNAEKISKRTVNKLLNEFEDVAKKIILKEGIDIEKEIEKKEAIARKPLPKKAGIKEQKEKEDAKKTEYINEEKKNKIMSLIRDGRVYIKRDLNKANDVYEEIYILYHQLPNDKKRELQEKIMDFYNSIRLELKS